MMEPFIPLIDHKRQPSEEWRSGVTTRMRVSALTGATQLTVFEQWCEPGRGAPTHWHDVEEVLTLLSGQADIWIGERRFRAIAGQSAVIAPELRHGFTNCGDGELHVLAILAAPTFEARYDDRTEVTRRWPTAE